MILASIHGRIVPNMCKNLKIGDSMTITSIHKGQGRTNYTTPILKVNKIGFSSLDKCQYRHIPTTVVTYTNDYIAIIDSLRGDEIIVKYNVHFDSLPEPIVVNDICLMCKLYDLMHRNGCI